MIIVCNIFCSKIEDHDILIEYLKSYPVKITIDYGDILSSDKPTLIVGWDYINKNFKNQNILDKKINDLIHWTYSLEENKDLFLRHAKSFVERSLIDWLPKNFILYDYFFDGDLKYFFNKNIDTKSGIFIFFYNDALYINNSNKNYIINLKNILHFDVINKKELFDILNYNTTVIMSYSNAKNYIDLDGFVGITLDSLFWVKHNLEVDESQLFNVIPNFEYKKYIAFFMSIIFPKEELEKEEKVFLERMAIRDDITWWASNRELCVEDDIKLENKEIYKKDNHSFVKINYSNKRTKTNRIVCKDEWNVQNEPRESPRRKKIISRFDGGEIFVYDYNSFETRISMFLTRDVGFIGNYRNKDIHNEVAREIFKKDNISDQQRDIGKLINHALLYGASHNRLLSILSSYVDEDEKEESLYYVKKMLEPIISNSKLINEECNRIGYVKTPWGSIVRPDKEYAAYNNLVQTIASEIIVDKMIEIREFLKDKKSQFLFQIHDSMVFDISPDENDVSVEILNIMSNFNKNKFNVSYKFGKNYLDLFDNKTFV